MTAPARNLTLTRDFRLDHAQVVSGLRPDYAGEPYCFVRFADGERAILDGLHFSTKADRWGWKPGFNPQFSDELRQAVALDLPGWHVGITAGSCHPEDHLALMRHVRVPLDRVTFAELFCFANFQRTNDLDWSGCWCVGPHANKPDRFGPRGHDFPLNSMELITKGRGRQHVMAALDWMLHEAAGPIVLSCGPVGKSLASLYWRATSGHGFTRRTVVDVGSGLGWFLHRRHTRNFQRTRTELNRWVPTW